MSWNRKWQGVTVQMEVFYDREAVFNHFVQVESKKYMQIAGVGTVSDPYEDDEDALCRPTQPRLLMEERKRLYRIFVRRFPEVVKRVRKVLSATPKYKMESFNYRPCPCPFPFRCSRFPCEKLSCNADELSNGNPWRRS